MAEQAFQLSENPDWSGASQALLNSLASLHDVEDRIELLETVCTRLGLQLYPAFLQILQYIELHGEHDARQLVATTLVDCLISGRLPTGSIAAWGSTAATGDHAFGQSRRLGPIEYVCVWYSQSGQESGLSDAQLRQALGSLVRLVSTDERATDLYIRKLRADASDPLSGSLNSKTRAGIDALATAWEADKTGGTVIEPFLNGIRPQNLLDQIARPASDFLTSR